MALYFLVWSENVKVWLVKSFKLVASEFVID